MLHVAKLFMNGRSQAVRLPAAYRFEGEAVHIHRDAKTGNVILSKRPQSLDHVLELTQGLKVPKGFPHTDRGKPVSGSDPFAGWEE